MSIRVAFLGSIGWENTNLNNKPNFLLVKIKYTQDNNLARMELKKKIFFAQISKVLNYFPIKLINK